MRGRAIGVVSAVALAACDNSAIIVDVHAPGADTGIGLDRVTMMIGMGASSTTSRIVLDNGLIASQVTYWSDPANATDTFALPADATNRHATFMYRPGGDYDGLGIAVALGYQGDETRPSSAKVQPGVSFPAGVVDRYDIGLNPAGDVATGGGRETFHLWGPTSTATQLDSSCVAVKDERGFSLVVLDGDEDCDGFATADADHECRPKIFQGSQPPELADVDHVAMKTFALPQGGTAAGCVLSGPGCIDGTGDAPDVPTSYCAPLSLCSACTDRTLDCAIPAARDFQAAVKIVCPLRVQPSSPAGYQICPDTMLVDPSSVSTTPITCTSTKVIGGVGVPLAGSELVIHRTDPSGAGYDAHFPVAAGGTSSCSFTVMATGSLPPLGTGLNEIPADFGLVVESEQSGAHGIALPIQFSYSALAGGVTCGAPLMLHCTASPIADGLPACLAATPAPGTRIDGK